MQPVGGRSRRLVRGTAINAVGAVVGQAIEFATVAVILRRTGAVAFGVVVLAQGWILLPYVFESGIGQQVVRAVAARGDERRDADIVISTAMLLYMLLGFAAAAVGVGIAYVALEWLVHLSDSLDGPAGTSFALIAVAGGLRVGSGFVPRALVGATRLPALRLVGLVRQLVTLGAVALLVDGPADGLRGAGIAILIGELAACGIGLTLVVPREVRPRLADVSSASIRCQISNAAPMTAAGGIGVFSTRVDPLIVAIALGPAATATYGIAVRAYDAVRSIVELISLVVMPETARLIAAGSLRRIQSLYLRALTYCVVVAWPAAFAVAIFGDAALNVITDESLPDGSSALIWSMLLVLVVTPAAVGFYVITGADLVREVLPAQLRAAVATLIVELVLIKTVGVGAVFLGSAVGALLLTRRYLTVVSNSCRCSTVDLMRVRTSVVIAVGALGVTLAVVRAARLSVNSSLCLLAVALLGYFGWCAFEFKSDWEGLRRPAQSTRSL